MLPVLTAAEMRAEDQKIIQQIGLPSLVLMENAARGVLDHIADWLTEDAYVLIYCGPGNNGADGLAVARQLNDAGSRAIVCLPLGEDKLSDEGKLQLRVLKQLDTGCIVSLSETSSYNPRVVVDALLGTGSRAIADNELAVAVKQINAFRSRGVKVVAVDIPTGLNADDGTFDDKNCVNADRTIAIGAYKAGFFQNKAKSVVGELRLARFGYPLGKRHAEYRTYLIERQDIIEAFPRQNDQASKFTNGRVFALAGSRGMTGAAIMCATSALRAGCGLVNVAVPESERSLVAQSMPELLTVGCSETEEGYPSAERYDVLEPHIEHADAILIGPGLRKAKGATELMLKIMTEVQKPMVIDAGAIATLQGDPSPLKARKAPTIITPHSGELSRLNGIEWEKVEERRLEYAREIAQEFKVIVVSKGAPSYTIDIDGTAYINSTGNAGLATAGSGDVLAGVIAGTLVQMPDRALHAAMIGTYVHGLAGDLAAEDLTQIAMTAMDVNRY
ncbi:MAG TPA: NAD(P)H-hydrate dehydratase, partial [Candidatus Kapabacteria bacterium]|nr:NAD(P)H-hydrate dehydratase [Candidatus Kapabacteria bacterium]